MPVAACRVGRNDKTLGMAALWKSWRILELGGGGCAIAVWLGPSSFVRLICLRIAELLRQESAVQRRSEITP